MNRALSARMRQALRIGAGLLLFLAGFIAGSYFRARGAQHSTARAPGAQQQDGTGEIRLPPKAGWLNPIETVAVSRTKLARDIEVVGSVGFAADHFAQVGPLIAGRIVTLRAGVGDKVRAGQVLAELESAEVGEAAAAYLSARATAAAAQINLRRERELAERRVSSSRELELADAHAATQQANLAATIERLRTLGLRLADIRELERGGGRPGGVPLVAPIDGTVLKRMISLGQAVQPATDAFQVADLSRLWVLLDLFEKDLRDVHVGQLASLRTEAYPGRVFPARVAYVGPAIDETTRTAPVRIEFHNRDGVFRPGQFVTAILHGDLAQTESEVLAVPRGAVLTIDGKPTVFVATADGGFVRRAIEMGIAGGGKVEVRSGVQAGDKVAVDAGFLLKSELQR